jgi:hypothetical protein
MVAHVIRNPSSGSSEVSIWWGALRLADRSTLGNDEKNLEKAVARGLKRPKMQ